MEATTISREGLGVILKGVSLDMKQHVEELRALDAVLGDGDLGVTIQMAGEAVVQAVSAETDDDVEGLLIRCGTSIRRVSPSTFGTLLGSAFIEAGRAAAGKGDLSVGDLSLLGGGAIAGIRKWGKAEVGDKTMLDALAPAVGTFDSQLHYDEETFDPRQALSAALEAARSGMAAADGMQARHGRTSWHQGKSVGVRDAGAAAMYYLVEAFARRTLAYWDGEDAERG
jgi:phosphoenolpyruvate---glycerone phosphotransferase subunit DhaL